jgi:Domain of unknown function (DUF5666)
MNFFASFPARGLRVLTAVTMTLAALVAGCGGGGVETGGTGAPASYSAGPIAGFGSIIVNGVRFDERAARITDDDGRMLAATDLKLGMTVRVDGGAIDPLTLTAVASAVHVGSDLIGVVTARDTTAGTLTLLGQTVRVTASTVFDDSLPGGLDAVTVGSAVEVFAILDPATGVYAAQRIEPEAAPAAYKLRGLVRALDTAARTLQMGGATITWAAGVAPADLADGQTVRVTLASAPDNQGRWVASRFEDATTRPPEGAEVEIESVVASYTSLADFTVSGVRVDASAANIEPAGATLAVGTRVEVEGRYRDGVLIATKVEVKGSGDDGGDDDDGGREIELHGPVSALDTTAKTFVLRGLTVDYSAAEFDDGTAANLANGVEVEVKGRLSDGGAVVIAEEVEFED